MRDPRACNFSSIKRLSKTAFIIRTEKGVCMLIHFELILIQISGNVHHYATQTILLDHVTNSRKPINTYIRVSIVDYNHGHFTPNGSRKELKNTSEGKKKGKKIMCVPARMSNSRERYCRVGAAV